MSLGGVDKKHLKKQKEQGDFSTIKLKQLAGKPDKQLLSGMVQFYEDVLDSLEGIFVAVFNVSGKFIEVWASPSLHELYGISPIEFKGRNIDRIFNPPEASQLISFLEKTFGTGENQYFEIKHEFPNGTFWLGVHIALMRTTKNQSTTAVVYFQNITKGVEIEQSLDYTNGTFKNYFENAPEGILICNSKGVVTVVNHALQEMSGYAASTFTGVKLSRLPFLNYYDVPEFQNILNDLYKSNLKPETFEWEWKTASGEDMWTEVIVKPNQMAGKLIGAQLTFRDVSEQKFIEKDLIKSKQAYKTIIENTREAIFIIQNNKVEFCNSAILEMLAFSMDELLGKNFIDFIYIDDKEVFRAFVNVNNFGKSANDEITARVITHMGNLKWIQAKTVMIDWNGKAALLVFANDITDHKLSEEKEKKHLQSIEFISQKAIDFGELSGDSNIYSFIGQKINEVCDDATVLIFSYNEQLKRSTIEHIEGEEPAIKKITKILENDLSGFSRKINHELVKTLSFGKLLKYNDGLFEYGYTIFPRNIFGNIQAVLNVGGIYLMGLNYEGTAYGMALIFLPKGIKMGNPEALETIGKLGSVALHRKNVWDALKKNTDKLHQIFNASQDIYYKADIDGIITEISPSATQLLGLPKEKIIGQAMLNFFAEKDNLMSFTRKLLREDSIADHDIRLLKKGKVAFQASLNARLLRNEKGAPIGSEGFIRDISERKKIEEKFQKSEEKFRALANYTYDWEYWVSPEGKIIYSSPSCQRITGYTAREFMAQPKLPLEITHPDDYKSFKRHMQSEEYNNKTDVLKLDYRIITKDNQVRWINHICQEVYNDQGKTLGRRISNRDITERKVAEQELRNSEARFKTLFYESPDAVFVEDPDGCILDVNPAACRLHQMERKDLIGKYVYDLVPEESRKYFQEHFKKWVNSGIESTRGTALTINGEAIPVEIHGSRISYNGKDALLFIVRDITQIVENEENLKRIAEKAEEADKLKSAFLANVSHEIRTPMNAIIGFSELLSNPDLTQEERDEFINYITQGSNTLMNLIEDIIDITKIEAGQIKINISECNLDQLMDELYATFLKMKNKSGKQKVDLRMNKPLIEKDFIISTDPNRIRQIFSNLIGNAIKFTLEGFIEFGFNFTSSSKIIFYVKDSGIGIPADKQKLIFDRFGQVEDKQQINQSGTGLGLSISKKLAKLLGGDLTVESKEGKGSTFILTLPLEKPYPPFEKELAAVKTSPPNWTGKSILIAEDSILNYTFLEALLQQTQVKLLWAKNGKEAVELCKTNKEIDLVLMDINMPVLNGFEAISKIKQFKKDLTIIVQTAYAMPEDRTKSLAAGADEHINKPIDPDELFLSIAKYLN